MEEEGWDLLLNSLSGMRDELTGGVLYSQVGGAARSGKSHTSANYIHKYSH